MSNGEGRIPVIPCSRILSRGNFCVVSESDFDSDLSPDNIHNRKVVEELDLRYDPKKRVYVNKDGCLRRDRYWQSY